MSSLENLTTLQLTSTELGENAFESIQMLPNLTVLVIDKACKKKELYFKAGGFQMLKSLKLLKLHGLRWVEIERGSMPSLEYLDIGGCELLQRVPSGVEHLAKLETLEIAIVSDNLVSRIDREKGGEDWWKIKHIPQVKFFYYNEDRNWYWKQL